MLLGLLQDSMINNKTIAYVYFCASTVITIVQWLHPSNNSNNKKNHENYYDITANTHHMKQRMWHGETECDVTCLKNKIIMQLSV